jgi:hypothetical protein
MGSCGSSVKAVRASMLVRKVDRDIRCANTSADYQNIAYSIRSKKIQISETSVAMVVDKCFELWGQGRPIEMGMGMGMLLRLIQEQQSAATLQRMCLNLMDASPLNFHFCDDFALVASSESIFNVPGLLISSLKIIERVPVDRGSIHGPGKSKLQFSMCMTERMANAVIKRELQGANDRTDDWKYITAMLAHTFTCDYKGFENNLTFWRAVWDATGGDRDASSQFLFLMRLHFVKPRL